LACKVRKTGIQDFEEGHAGWFILAGVMFTVVFVATVLTVVNLVLP